VLRTDSTVGPPALMLPYQEGFFSIILVHYLFTYLIAYLLKVGLLLKKIML